MSMLVGSSHDMSSSVFEVMMTSLIDLLCVEHSSSSRSCSGINGAVSAQLTAGAVSLV